MKKLMTALATAATALFAIGAANGDEAPLNATSFEELTLNTQLNTLADDTGDTEGEVKYWYMASTDADNGTLVTNEVAGAGVSRPDYFAKMNQANTKALSLDTSSPLFRHMGTNTSGTLPATGEAIGDGIYLDTLVKFTAADDVFGDDALAAGDKIAISYVEQSDEVENPITNFVIRAGKKVGEDIQQVNYIAAAPAGFDKDAWHRLTVRAIADVGDGQVGFIVYLDGNPDKFLAYDASIDAGFTEVLPRYADKYYNSTIHAIYPSAVAAGATGGSTITAASFSGTGAIDDVVFTAVKPDFIQEQAIVTIAWDAGFTGVTIDNVAVTAQELAAGKKDVQLNGTVVSVSYTLASGYEEGTFTGGTWESGSSEGSGSFTGLKSGDTCTLVSMQPKFDVGGVHYESLEDALEAAIEAGTSAQSPATLKLLANCAECITLSSGYVIIDLAGHDIQGGDEDSFSINCKDGANVVVTNSIPSTGAVKLSLIEDAATAMSVKGDATRVSVYDTKFEGSIKVTSDDADETALLKIFSGTFYDDNADGVVEDFKYTKYIQNSAKVTYLGSDYFQVGEGSEQPTTYALTIPAVKIAEVTAATATVTAGEETISDLSAIPAGTVVTVTWTAEDGYKITAGATEEITMSENKTATAPSVQAIVYATLTITPVNNCTIVVSNATDEVASGTAFDVDDNVTLTVYRTPAEGFKLADGCAATEVITMDEDRTVTASVVQDGEKTYPSYIDDHAAYQDAYDTWKDANSVADGDNKYEAAFLLNIAPDAADQTLEPASITIADGKVVITANKNLGTVNGKVYVKTATTLAGLKTAEWVAATLDDDKAINVTPVSTDTAGFYQIKVDF